MSERYEGGRARFVEVHDEKALASIEGLGELGTMIVEVVYGDVYARPVCRRGNASWRRWPRWYRSAGRPNCHSTSAPP